MRIKMLPGALVIAALVTLAISLGVATPNVYGGSDDSLPTLPEKPELKYPNLGSNLDQLVASVEKGETSAKEAAEDAPVHQEASVAVTIYLSGNVDDVVKFLEDNGGSPRNVGEDYIEAYVPVSLLGQVSDSPESSGCGKSSLRRTTRAPNGSRATVLQYMVRQRGTRPGSAARVSRWG